MFTPDFSHWHRVCYKDPNCFSIHSFECVHQATKRLLRAPLCDGETVVSMEERRPSRKTAVGLRIERSCSDRSDENKGHSDWETIKDILDHLGYEVKFVRVAVHSRTGAKNNDSVIPFHRARSEGSRRKRPSCVEHSLNSCNKPRVTQLYAKGECVTSNRAKRRSRFSNK